LRGCSAAADTRENRAWTADKIWPFRSDCGRPPGGSIWKGAWDPAPIGYNFLFFTTLKR
jgi:hypothetical protein